MQASVGRIFLLVLARYVEPSFIHDCGQARGIALSRDGRAMRRQAYRRSPHVTAKVSDTTYHLPGGWPEPWRSPMQEHSHSIPVAFQQAGAHFSWSRNG